MGCSAGSWLRVKCNLFTYQAIQQMCQIGQGIPHIKGFRTQRLFARKCKKLSNKGCRTVCVLIDLNQIAIIAITLIMTQQATDHNDRK